jgi:predicted amidophosphoribosyltransferase
MSRTREYPGHPIARIARAATDAALSILLAPACAACQRLLDHPSHGCVCEACWSSVSLITPPVCDRCGDPLSAASIATCRRCRRMPRAIDRGRAAGHYEDSLRDIIHAFKYEGRRSLAHPLAALMRRQAGDLLDDVDWIVPVPLHWRRARERGFNQASDLARALIARYSSAQPGPPTRGVDALRWRLSPCVAAQGRTASTRRPRLLHALRRVRHTTVQAELPAARRHKNVRDAFALSGGTHPLKGSCVLLVDDVSTTGATIEACARVLKDAGVKEVRAVTAARVVTRPSR